MFQSDVELETPTFSNGQKSQGKGEEEKGQSSPARIFPETGCSLRSKLPVPVVESLTFAKVFCAPG